MSDLVRVHTSSDDKEGLDGRDEGGNFRMKEVVIPPKYKKRMTRCGGCYNASYNYRSNVGDRSWCWSIENGENFRKRGNPKCFIRR